MPILTRALTAVLFLTFGVVPVAPLRAPRYFAETGHSLAEPLLSYWTNAGGLPVFGFPISEPFQDVIDDGGTTALTQYFERSRLEAHPELPAPYSVLLGRLGVDRLRQQGREWQHFPQAHPDTPHYFTQTGHAIAHRPFWAFWRSHGLSFDGQPSFSEAESLALFGYPISEAQVETNANGDTVLTQWFERARFEDHGAAGVLLGLLGNEHAAARQGERPFQRVQPAPAPAVGQDLQWVSHGIFAIFNEIRSSRNVPAFVYRSDLQAIADQAAAEYTAAQQNKGNVDDVFARYNRQLHTATPWADMRYGSWGRPLNGCGVRAEDPLAGFRSSTTFALTELRTFTVGVFGPYNDSCGPSYTVIYIFGQ